MGALAASSIIGKRHLNLDDFSMFHDSTSINTRRGDGSLSARDHVPGGQRALKEAKHTKARKSRMRPEFILEFDGPI